ncbi:MAG: hypothetical protein O9353_11925 [Bacteroidia bacterium]|nr:hypothetical protein [Bacteroidia bacterium]
MAKKQQPIVDQTPTELTTHKDEFNKVLDERILIGEEIYKSSDHDKNGATPKSQMSKSKLK